MKQSIEKCLSEYTPRELAQFHANLNVLFLCCTEDFHLLPLLMHVHSALMGRKDRFSKKYLSKIDDFLSIPKKTAAIL